MTATQIVELEGHIIDSGMMQHAFSLVMDIGGSFHVEQFDVGTLKDETSYCRMEVTADDGTLREIVHALHQTGANIPDVDAELEAAPEDRVDPPSTSIRRRTTLHRFGTTASESTSRTSRWIAPSSSTPTNRGPTPRSSPPSRRAISW